MTKQLDGKEDEATEVQPINLGLPTLKELGAKWLVQMAEYFADNPQIIVNGFTRAGIMSALDNTTSELEDMEDEEDTESDFGVSDEEEQNEWKLRTIKVRSFVL